MAGTFARNSALSAVAGLFTTLGGFLSTVLVARLLGVEGAGVVAFATWLVTVALTLADLGVPGALARYLPELHGRGEEVQARGLALLLFQPFLAALLVITGAFLAYAAWLAWGGGGTAVRPGAREAPLFWVVVALSCLVQGFAAYLNGLLKGLQDFRLMARLAILSAVLQVGATLLGSLVLGAPGAMLGAVAGGLAPALLIAAHLPRADAVGPELRRRVTRFTLESWGGYLVGAFAWSRMEIFFLERSWGSEAVGLFAVSLTLSNLAAQGLLLLTGGLLPYLSQTVATAPDKADEAYAAATRVVAFLVLPACAGLAAIAPVLLPWLYGAAFAQGVPTMVILMLAAAAAGTAAVASTYLIARERTRFLLGAGLLGAGLSVASGLTIVPAYGPVAAAAGRAGIQVLLAALLVGYIARRLGVRVSYGALGRLLLAAGLCALAASLGLRLVTGPLGLVIAIPFGALAYALGVRLLGALPAGDVERLASFAAVLPGPLARPAAAALKLLAPARGG